MRPVRSLVLGVILGLALGEAFAEPVVREARVTSENRGGKAWTVMVGRVEAVTDLTIEQLAAVISDWPAYPRLFPQIRRVETLAAEDAVLLSETVVVSALGFEVTKRFTLRMRVSSEPSQGRWSLLWTQERTDGTIEDLEGGWELTPASASGGGGTRVVYRTLSAVPQSIPGQDGLVGLFYPGELKQIVQSVLIEARKRKEKA